MHDWRFENYVVGQQLVEQRKSMRMSIHKQGDFLDACMAKKP